MKLPDEWIEKVMEAMAVRYGAEWLRMWEGVPIAKVKEDWATGLGWLWRRPDALRYGLANLPESPPNMAQFRAICNRCPDPEQKALPRPKADPKVVAKGREALRRVQRQLADEKAAGPSAVDRLLQLEAAGQQLTPGQRGFLQAALARSSAPEAGLFDAANFRPIPAELQPPGSAERAAAEFYSGLRRAGRGHMPVKRAEEIGHDLQGS